MTNEKTWQFIADNYKIDDYLIDKIFSDETEAIIEHIIKELPDQCSKVFIMSRIESLNNGEIALRLGLSENTVKTHIYRALQKIAIALKLEK
jgi:RNA polymerase sigma-70 factor (ECF subfamily)